MGNIRIKIAKDKTELVKALLAGDNTTGPFQYYVDALIFAASLGLQRQSKKEIAEYSKDIDPIRQDIFHDKGYTQAINLIAVADSNDPKLVANNDDAEEKRIRIFEEYANGGLEILSNKLAGFTNYTECILLMLDDYSAKDEEKNEEFDLSNFI